MTLSYRGVSYRSESPTVEQLESDLSGQYRGHRMQFGYPRHIPATHPVVELTYRGVSYRTTATGAIESPSNSVSRPLRDLLTFRNRAAQTPRSTVIKELSSVHNRNLYQLLERRIQVARSSGNQKLVDQLEQERSQLA
ncbi:MAG: DUF4278 domain-containing protein [Elainellaceae cyanobacterium]